MSDSLSDQANKAAIAAVKSEKASSFTVGGYLTRDGEIVGGITYDRKLTNLWGLTAYARAYWHDQPVTVGKRPIETEAGVELRRTF